MQEHGMYNEALVYGFIAACFGRIDVIRCSSESCIESVLVEMETKLMNSFKTLEQNGMNSTDVDEMLEVVKRFAEVDENFLDQPCAHQEFLLRGDEPECEAHIPQHMPEEYLWYEIPAPFDENSPEHMAQWMISRLTKRLSDQSKQEMFTK